MTAAVQPAARPHLPRDRQFASDWEWQRPCPGRPAETTCPRCGSSEALVERIGNRLYGSHDKPGQCGWTAVMEIVRRG